MFVKTEMKIKESAQTAEKNKYKQCEKRILNRRSKCRPAVKGFKIPHCTIRHK